MNRPATDFLKIETLMMHGVVFHTIMDCLELKLFEDFEGVIFSAEIYASKYGFQLRSTEALLDLLIAHGLLLKTGAGYTNTKLTSEHLVINSPYYQGNLLRINTYFNDFSQCKLIEKLKGNAGARDDCDESWAMEESIKGSAAHARLGALQDTTEFITSLPEFSQMRFMCDIGGSHGEFTTALLDRNSELKGEITDLSKVCEVASRYAPLDKFQDRITFTPRDIRSTPLPKDSYDLIIASHILYAFVDDFDGILKMIHAALKDGGWFVTQHMDKRGGLSMEYSSTLEFITRLSGYDTHFIEAAELTDKFDKAGFNCVAPIPAGCNGIGVIVAGYK